jgi:cytochrome P450
MTDVLTADNELYEELYDVRKEAEDAGNLVEGDANPGMCALRDQAPVHKGFLRDLLGLPAHHRHTASVGREGYTCFTFDVCNAAFRDNERFSNATYHMDPRTDEQTLSILEMDEPQHRAYRATVQPMFLKPRALTWWRQRWINEIVDALITKLHRQDRAELNLQLCARVPVHTVTRAMGLRGDDSLVFRHALHNSSGRSVTPAARMEAAATVERMLMELIARRRAAPEDDLISGLVAAELDLPGHERRRLTDREIMLCARIIMIAGGGTSWRQFGITLWALLTNRDQLEAVKADRRLVDAAIEESVRWNPTDPVFTRLATCDIELGGVVIPKNAVLEICLGAANRDPARWDNPDAYDLHRPHLGHLGFGIGPHQCLGKNVAHAEINAGINALLDRFPNLRLDPDAPETFLTGGLEQRGVSSLHVLLN